jgi:hypothetical protein
MRYGTKNLVKAANEGNVEAQLLTSALLMLHEQPMYVLATPDELLRDLILYHRKLIDERRKPAQ